MRTLGPADHLLADARGISPLAETLELEIWASGWLGAAWSAAELGEREAEEQLCREVAATAARHPSPASAIAVAALARVAPPAGRQALDDAIAAMGDAVLHPGLSGPVWTATAGHRAVDVWQSERAIFVDFDGPQPHTLMASILDVGGTMVERLEALLPGAVEAWEESQEPDDPPMPVLDCPAEEALAEIAEALRATDMLWPRPDEERFVELRALAWSRSRDHLRQWPEWEAPSEAQREEWIEGFVQASGLPDDEVTWSLADLFIDYGAGYLHGGTLSWDPGSVMLFLTDYLPRKVALDAEQRAALPDALRHWLRYALAERGVEPRWIEPVVAEVDEGLPEFEEAFDDEAAWGPAKSLVAQMESRGIDLADRQAVEDAISAFNAESLARRLRDES